MTHHVDKMETFSLYVVENSAIVDAITNHLQHHKDFALVGSQYNPNIALEEILKKERFPDAVIINAELCAAYQSNLPELLTKHTLLIVTSRFAADAALAFDYNAVDFLISPIVMQQLDRALNRVRLGKNHTYHNDSHRHFYIQSEAKGKMIRLNCDDVFYIEACQNYVTIYLEKSKYITYLTMKELEEKLLNTSFLRVHKSYLVNESKIHAVDGDYVVLENNFFIKIGSNYKEGLFASLHPNFFVSKRNGLKAVKQLLLIPPIIYMLAFKLFQLLNTITYEC